MTPSMWLLSVACAIMIGMAKIGIQGIGTLVVPLMVFIFGGMPSSVLVLPIVTGYGLHYFK